MGFKISPSNIHLQSTPHNVQWDCFPQCRLRLRIFSTSDFYSLSFHYLNSEGLSPYFTMSPGCMSSSLIISNTGGNCSSNENYVSRKCWGHGLVT
jgi:hypothetical protein